MIRRVLGRYLVPGLVILAAGLFVWLQLALRQRADLQLEADRLRRSNAALQAHAEQAQLARDVEAARAERFAARSADLQATIDAIEGIPDAPLHSDLIKLFDPARR